jgi:3-oxoacyl-[acyl-carrier-protein] synthase II
MRVVITGMGIVSSLGQTPKVFFDALAAGRSGLCEMNWDTRHELEVRAGGPVLDFAFEPRPGQSVAGDRCSQFALAAARQAACDAGLVDAGYAPQRIATLLGVGMGGYQPSVAAVRCYHEHGANGLGPDVLRGMSTCAPSELVAEELGAEGPNHCIVSACASSAHAIGEAFELLRAGGADAVVTGGAESVLDPAGIAAFERIGALSTARVAPQRASRPFDRDRDGFVMGEGAGVLVLETYERARRRGAPIYAEILGYGASSDAFHATRSPDDGEGMARAIQAALQSAGIARERVDYVNAHGTSTPLNDVAETAALKRVFGAHARELWISSTKSMIGHLLGAAAAVETIATVCALGSGIAPPTRNLEQPDEQCDLDYLAGAARSGKLRFAIKNSFGFGGQNACLVLGRCGSGDGSAVRRTL